jgi:hypothetical protein
MSQESAAKTALIRDALLSRAAVNEVRYAYLTVGVHVLTTSDI